jgi:hypothetical protein
MKRACLVALVLVVLGAGTHLLAQFNAAEIADYDKWEDFLKTAKVVAQKQLTGAEAVTSPYVLTLEKDGVQHKALWKNVYGLRVKGFKETWKGEIAAYRISRLLGLNMVPPTVEREFQGDKGSCQMFVDYWNNLETILKKKLNPPGIKSLYFNRALCLQRAFDNLIYNVDRHQRNYLIMEDWRMALIDHSRTFAYDKKARTDLIYDEKYKEGPQFIMASMPRALYDALKALTAESIRTAVGTYLEDDEISAVLDRRDLIIAWMDKYIAKEGEQKVLY